MSIGKSQCNHYVVGSREVTGHLACGASTLPTKLSPKLQFNVCLCFHKTFLKITSKSGKQNRPPDSQCHACPFNTLELAAEFVIFFYHISICSAKSGKERGGTGLGGTQISKSINYLVQCFSTYIP